MKVSTRTLKNSVMLAVSCLAAATACAQDYFVAPQGVDANPGTLERPFATLRRAQEAARQAQAPGRTAVTVRLREGTYYLSETLILTAEDSGTKAAPIVYQAYQKESVVISGGFRLENLKWEPYQNGIMQAKVPAGTTFDQLFVDGNRQHMARYPNFDPNVRHFNGYAADAISPQRAARWRDPAGGFIHAMHASEWGGMHYLITGSGPDNKVTYEGGWQNNRPSGMHRQFRMVENIFEELDAPGEWFLDGKTGTLYFYPPAGVNLAAAVIEAVRLRHLIEFRGTEQSPVRFVTLKGLTFRHAARTFMDNKEPLVRSDWTTYRGGAVFYTGTEDCALEDCFIDQVGGNAVFVNNYNRRLTVRGCHIAKAGGNGVAFIGDRDAARVPRDWKDKSQSFATLDRTPGPKSNNYPADCLVEDCLIHETGRVEKQTAPVQIELAQSITVRHCSLYDVPRAGINIGDGCWGGHVIEFCDIFDTVKETGDHGSFNSWGRDRFWGLNGLDLNNDKVWEAEKSVPVLDAIKTVILRNNRWRCDHGWDIDLDDGSTNYELRNNLCLNGGIKNREGFFRVVENNIMVNNGFHPHVWYKHSEDVVRRNIMWSDHYLPAGGMPATPWGKDLDCNLVHRAGVTESKPAAKLAEQSKRDAHSIVADALFVDPAGGDFRVKDGSPALSLGFVNFPMDQFGVQKPELKAIARTPLAARAAQAQPAAPDCVKRANEVSQYIQKTFWDDRTGMYHKTVSDKHPDFMWPCGVMFSSLVAASRHDPSFRPVLEKFFVGLNGYWDSKAGIPGYEPAPTRGGGNDKYYDDNAWMVLTLLEAYELTRDAKYLARAEETLKFVLSGWDDELGGGIWWHEAHKDGTKNACANAPAAAGCLRLAKYKNTPEYVGWAVKIVEWTRRNLQDKDGLFDDRKVVATGEIKRGKLTYNTALMIRSLLGLWRRTGEAEYLDEAKRVGKASGWFLKQDTGAYRDNVKWSHLLVEADLELYRATKEEYLLERARKNGEHHYNIWKAKQPQDLMTNAAIARLLWLLADHETPAGRAFWEESDR